MEQGWSQLRPGQLHSLAIEKEKGTGNVCFSQPERKDNFHLKQVRQNVCVHVKDIDASAQFKEHPLFKACTSVPWSHS